MTKKASQKMKMATQPKVEEKPEINTPNETTIQTFQHTNAGANLVHAKNKDDLFEKLEL